MVYPKLLAKGFLFLCLLSCVTTSYTRDEETQITNDLVNIILGQFAHHGVAFYQHEESKNKELLAQNSKNFQARNDLAVAQLKQGKWHQAIDNFSLNEQTTPRHYDTAINLGILYKKKGDLSLAINHIEQSLQIKSEGHMRLGNYYLRMVKWKKSYEIKQPSDESDSSIPLVNFLDIPYETTPSELKKSVNKTYLIRLIKNDYQFSDAYLVLGDALFAEGKHQLAYRSYIRAQNLEHPHDDILYDRLNTIYQYWKDNKQEGYVLFTHRGKRQVRQELERAKKWLIQFQHMEERLLKQNSPADFTSTLSAMKTKEIERPKVIDAAYFKGRVKHNYFFQFLPLIFFAFIAIILFLVYKTIRYYYNLKVAAA